MNPRHSDAFPLRAAVLAAMLGGAQEHSASYQTDMPPGVWLGAGMVSAVGDNGRRMLIVASPDGLYLGDVLLKDAQRVLALAEAIKEMGQRMVGDE